MIREYILEHCVKYQLDNKAPKTISYPEDEPKHFGFWDYLTDGDDRFVLRGKHEFLTYKCTKFNPSDDEKDVIHIKSIKDKTNIFNNNEVTVNLFYNGYELSGITPLKAYLYGATQFYKFLKWYEIIKWKRTQNKHKKALSHYKDRFLLLGALISLYEDEQENFSVIVDDAIEINTLAPKLTNSNNVRAIYYSREQLEPTLQSVQSDELIEVIDSGNIKLQPKAWSELSKYIIEERRHTDNQKAL